MSLTLLLSAVFLFQGQGDLASYKDPSLNLSFSYPKTWKFEQRKNDARLTIPLDASSQATVDLFRFGYVGGIDDWLATQRNVNISVRAETIRQWQEEILGVPLVLTKSKPNTPADPKLVLQGLIYSHTDSKLLFRLTAPVGLYDQAEFDWRKALESLRTLDGTIPKPENPDRIPDPPKKGEKKPKTLKPPTETRIGAGKGRAPKLAPNVVKLKAAARDVELHIPSTWTFESKGDGGGVLKNADLPGELKIEVASTLDSDAPGRALIKASVASLKYFEKVDQREDWGPKTNGAGALVSRVWRMGTGTSGGVCSFDGVGATGDNYWIAMWSGPSSQATKAKELLEKLISQMSVEQAP